MTTRVAVVGAAGRMGSVTCEAVEQATDLDLVARVDSGDPLDAVLDAGADVAVEFTTPDSVRHNTEWLLQRGVHVVVGATGMSDDDLAELAARTGPANCLVAPNFAVGAVLLMQLASKAAAVLPDVEITEAHHPGKADAPSGTARRTARLVGETRPYRPDPPGPAGEPSRGREIDGVPVHAVRLPGVVASQEVVFGAEGQTLSLRHDAIDRTAFMPGVLLAVRRIDGLSGLTVGLDPLLV
jgi:4-hydroxy-tetrahydrodipicolinate reductase